MKIPLLAAIFQGIPESIAIATFAFAVAKIHFSLKKLILIGLIIAFTSYFVRLLPLTFGIPTIINMIMLFILLVFVGKGSITVSLIATLLSSLSIIIVENICLPLLMTISGITSELFFANTLIRILITLPQVVVMFVLAFLIRKFRTRKDSV